ncbi:TIGR02391 family protein [Geodermatophilus sp. SYSU D00691]
MEAERDPNYLKALAEAVTDFRDALSDLLELYTEFGTRTARGVAPSVVPREASDPQEIKRRKSRVSRAAGRASEATKLTNAFIHAHGHGLIDPIAAWLNMTQPKPLLEPDDVFTACDSILGRLDAMMLRAQSEAPPRTGPAGMHPLVWGAARRLWLDGHIRQAVTGACEALIGQVKVVTGRNDVAETSLWQQVFSKDAPEPGKPRLRWPGPPTDQTVKTMNDGLRQYAPGVQLLIRNPAVHTTVEMTEQEGLEQLAALSLLARWMENCTLDEAPAST